MTGMEHAIERAVEVIWECGPWTDQESLRIARALAEAGLLAPAPLREEWGQRWTRLTGEVRVMTAKDREDADPGGEAGVEALHRFVSDWLPADDGRDECDESGGQ